MYTPNATERLDLYGLKFSNVNFKQTIDLIINYNFNNPDYICFPSTNIVAKVHKDEYLKTIFNSSFLTLADGKFTEYYFKLKGNKNIENISGFWLLRELLNTDLKHYFYGGSQNTLNKLKFKIEKDFPDAKVIGYSSPPFVKIEDIKDSEQIKNDILHINQLKPDLIWIGISNLKQDVLMHHFVKELDQGLMLGVGAVFLYMSGEVKKGPEWVKKLGLRWLIRVIQEPRKEWKKTVPSVLIFIKLFFLELLKYPFRKK